MPRVVGVEAGGDQGAAILRVVVGVAGGLAAGAAVSVVLVGAHARRVALQDWATEAAFVLAVVPALPCAAASLLYLGSVCVALAVLGVLGAPGFGADAPALGLGHAASTTVSALGVVRMKASGALGVFVVGLVVFMVGVAGEFTVIWLAVGSLLMLGAVAATPGRRRTGPDPDVTLRPGGEARPWRSQAEDADGE
ncbi:hypothetical protein QA811_17705 [Streptomyces sp. B21-102]|uniref:hypothetical protein n=1 Tax=Streptomyces sp. B21-102 TaxID=3039416 RepID=UPI002FF35396